MVNMVNTYRGTDQPMEQSDSTVPLSFLDLHGQGEEVWASHQRLEEVEERAAARTGEAESSGFNLCL